MVETIFCLHALLHSSVYIAFVANFLAYETETSLSFTDIALVEQKRVNELEF